MLHREVEECDRECNRKSELDHAPHNEKTVKEKVFKFGMFTEGLHIS